MPTLEFKGKQHIYTHHFTVPYRPLETDETRSSILQFSLIFWVKNGIIIQRLKQRAKNLLSKILNRVNLLTGMLMLQLSIKMLKLMQNFYRTFTDLLMLLEVLFKEHEGQDTVFHIHSVLMMYQTFQFPEKNRTSVKYDRYRYNSTQDFRRL